MAYQQRLILDLYGSLLEGDTRHAQDIIKSLGISYQIAVPQSMMDCWEFYNYENVPVLLPTYLRAAPIDPFTMVGYGLSIEMAQKIASYQS